MGEAVEARLDFTRPGPARTVWEARFPWEGNRLLAQLDQLPPADQPLDIHAYVSESPEMRAFLRGAVLQKFQAATARVRSAYKTGFFWLTEEVQPLWRRLHADRLTVRYPVAPDEAPGRFLQELYPLAAVLEREGVQGEFLPGGAGPFYQATLSSGEVELWRGDCFVPLHPRTSPDGRPVLGPTGWLTVRGRGELVHDARVPTDGELFWDWYADSVLPHLLNLADARPGLPIFKNLSVTAHLSEPDLALGVLDERVSMTEAITEEVYFGTLDALKRHTGTPVGARSLMPGRIVPVAVSTPGQDGWARVVLTEWGGVKFPTEHTADSAPPVRGRPGAAGPRSLDRPWKPAHTWAAAREQAKRCGLDWEIPAYSVDGRPVPVALRRGDAVPGGVIVTGGQHANETTGPVAAVQLIQHLAATPLAFAVLPIENPDGAHLHRALCQLNPEHMHHAARYTSLGDDLESRLRAGDPRWESRARAWAAAEVGATLHLNLHGYPAHEWVRPYSGYAPHGFESWALPVGFLTIVWYAPGEDQNARGLAGAIATRLQQEPDVVRHAARACRASAAHSARPHYELIQGLPFILTERPGGLCPMTVITEAPDETIYGQHFAMFVRAHLAVAEAAVHHHLGDPTPLRGPHDQ